MENKKYYLNKIPSLDILNDEFDNAIEKEDIKTASKILQKMIKIVMNIPS